MEELESIQEITWDHRCFYKDQEKITGLIEEIVVDMETFENEVESLVKQAEAAVFQGKWIVWHLDFHFAENPLFIDDSALFFSQGLSIEEFAKKLYGPFQKNTLAASLFQGDSDFSRYFIWTEQHELYYQEKAGDWQGIEEGERKRVFAADIFSGYLQRLSSFFPDTLAALCLVDVAAISSPSLCAFFFTRERFGHLLLALRSSSLPIGPLQWLKEGLSFQDTCQMTLGVCLTSNDKVTQNAIAVFDDVFQKLCKKNIAFRLLEEDFLTESWDGINDLIVLTSYVSTQGVRKMRGFVAAGGRVVSQGPVLGLEDEVSFSVYLSS